MIDPLFSRLASAALGLQLLAAAWHKFSMGGRLRTVVAGYRLLPHSLVAPVARIVPALEAVLGILLLAGIGRPAGSLAAAALFAAYGLAIAVNVLRGRVHIDCGCGFGDGEGSGPPLSWWMVLRNAVFAGLVLTPLLSTGARPLGAVDWVTVVAALLALGLLYAATLQISANRAAIRSWRLPHD